MSLLPLSWDIFIGLNYETNEGSRNAPTITFYKRCSDNDGHHHHHHHQQGGIGNGSNTANNNCTNRFNIAFSLSWGEFCILRQMNSVFEQMTFLRETALFPKQQQQMNQFSTFRNGNHGIQMGASSYNYQHQQGLQNKIPPFTNYNSNYYYQKPTGYAMDGVGGRCGQVDVSQLATSFQQQQQQSSDYDYVYYPTTAAPTATANVSDQSCQPLPRKQYRESINVEDDDDHDQDYFDDSVPFADDPLF